MCGRRGGKLHKTKDVPGLSHRLLKEKPDSFLHGSPRFEIRVLLLDEELVGTEGAPEVVLGFLPWQVNPLAATLTFPLPWNRGAND